MTTHTPSLMLDHLNLSVNDLAETADWYGRVFGFEVVERGLYKGKPWAILKSGDAMLCAYEHDDRRQATNEEMDQAHLHFVSHWGMRVRDREAWEATVEREGLEVGYGGEVRWPNSSSWYVFDPSGYEIEVVHWKGDTISFQRATATP